MADPFASSETEQSRTEGKRGPALRLLRRPFLLLLASALLPVPCLAFDPLLGGGTVTLVDIDLASGGIHVTGPDRNLPSQPGSTLKPMVLLTAMQLGVITPQTRVACNGSLHIAGRNLACAHPVALGVLDPEEALAYSCNTYFARVAQQLPPSALEASLQRYGIGALQPVRSPADRVLFALGLEHVAVTPLQLAHAYARFARDLASDSRTGDLLREGLLGSVTYGMAHGALTPGLLLGGKTGTAHDRAPLLQHGWFAGIAFASGNPAGAVHVVVVYAPGGNGNDAALAAHQYLQRRRW